MSEQKRQTLNLGRILSNALAEVQKPRIVAECWTCGHRNSARRGLLDAPRGITERRAEVCRALRHDVRPVEEG